MLKITDKIQIPLREFDFTFARSSGPGGQNVNKVNTKAFLTWHVEQTESLPWAVKDRFVKKFSRRISKEGKIIVVSQRFRDQGRNVADCITKLQELVRSVVAAPVKRRKTKPSKGAIQRRINDKKATSERKSRRRPLRGDEWYVERNSSNIFLKLGINWKDPVTGGEWIRIRSPIIPYPFYFADGCVIWLKIWNRVKKENHVRKCCLV